MKLAAVILAPLIPLLAEGAELFSLDDSIRERQATLRQMEASRQEVDAALRALGSPPREASAGASTDTSTKTSPNASAEARNDELPTPVAGETVAVADGGMLFDTNNSRITYLDNVRVNDARLRMRCSHRLYIQLPRQTSSEQKKKAIKASSKPSSRLTPSQQETTQPTFSQQKASQQETSQPASSQQGTPRPETCTPTEVAAPAPRVEEALDIRAREAIVDTEANQILLMGGKKTLALRRGQQELLIEPTGETPNICLLADTNGDIYLPGGKISLTWVDEQGKKNRLNTEGGLVYFHAESRRLLIDGASFLETEEGTLRCRESLVLSFREEEKEKPSSPPGGFMPRLTSLRLAGIAGAEARGQVELTLAGTESRPPSELRGDALDYDGLTGACHLSGRECLLVFGNNWLSTDGDVKLAGNGDIFLTGNRIEGTYERPVSGGSDAVVQGRFHTVSALTFRAGDNTLTAPDGLTMKEENGSFSCTGPLELELMTRPGEEPPTPKRGIPVLAIARCHDVARLHASGQVALHREETPEAPAMELEGSDLEANLQTGEALLTAAGGQQARIRYGLYELAATDPGKPSSLQLNEKGDVDVRGARVLATLPDQGEQVRVSCSRSLHLLREEGRLLLGPDATITSPRGILTTKGEMEAQLLAGEPEKAKPVHPRFPHLVYNVAGLRSAATREGGTLQTGQGSMQCTGPISLVMNPTTKGTDDSPLATIQSASASGQVAVAGRDNTGRLVRATGNLLEYNDKTRLLRLSGQRVTLADAYNTHTASGPNACVTMDEHRVTRITGANHTTTATRIHEQQEQQKQKKED